MVQPEQVGDAEKMIQQTWTSARLLHSIGGVLKFKIDGKVQPSEVFFVMQKDIKLEVRGNS